MDGTVRVVSHNRLTGFWREELEKNLEASRNPASRSLL